MPPSDVAFGVECAFLGKPHGFGDESWRGSLIEHRVVHDSAGNGVHLFGCLEPSLPVRLRFETAERLERSGGIEHVARDGIGGREVAHGIGEHGGNLVRVGQLEQASRVREAPRATRLGVVTDDVEGYACGEGLHPPGQFFGCAARGILCNPARHRVTHIGVRAEQYGDVRAVGPAQ